MNDVNEYEDATAPSAIKLEPSTPAGGYVTELERPLPIHSSQLIATTPRRGGTVPLQTPQQRGEEVEEEEDERQALAEDDFSEQQLAQSKNKENLKILMEHFSPDQQSRYEWYRRSTLNKGTVRKLIQQQLGQNVSVPVSQLVAGVAKVFVGEIVEKALDVQERRHQHGPLAPEHIREAYQMYKEEKGNVGSAKPLRGKRLAL